MTSIAFLSKSKFKRAKIIAGDDEAKLIKVYKEMTPAWVEGKDEEIESTKKYISLPLPKKVKKTKKTKKGKRSKK